jgi:membrane fusion protein (multidrug efflux system)
LNKPVRNISIILIFFVIAALLVVPKLLSEKNKQQTGSGPNTQQDIPVDVYIVEPVNLENEVATVGTIIANEEVEVKSELTRKIRGIYFKEGSFVHTGKILFKLDDSDILARLRRLDLDEELNLKQQEREKQLLDKGLLTPDEYDVREINIEKIRADIEVLEVEFSKTEIRAPFSGRTGFRIVSIGSLVNNSVVLTTIQDISRVKVDFSIPEKYINLFSPGQEIAFAVDGYDEDFSGRVISYDPQINENTRTIVLRATANNKGNKLLPGSFVKVKLRLDNVYNAVMVPSESIVPKLKGQSVFVYQDGVAVMKDVDLGIRTDKSVQVTSNLSVGDTIITTNILRLRPNGKVKIVNLNK